MQRVYSPLFTLVLLVMLGSCGQQPADDSIQSLEARFKEVTSASGSEIDHNEIREVMGRLAAAYEKFATEHPEDPATPEYLYKAAELYETNMMNISQSMQIFDNIIQKYPDHDRAADALFKKGYVLHNTLSDTAKARQVYSEFLNRYPDHELAASAKFEIANLGVDARELLERIQQLSDSMAQETSESPQ